MLARKNALLTAITVCTLTSTAIADVTMTDNYKYGLGTAKLKVGNVTYNYGAGTYDSTRYSGVMATGAPDYSLLADAYGNTFVNGSGSGFLGLRFNNVNIMALTTTAGIQAYYPINAYSGIDVYNGAFKVYLQTELNLPRIHAYAPFVIGANGGNVPHACSWRYTTRYDQNGASNWTTLYSGTISKYRVNVCQAGENVVSTFASISTPGYPSPAVCVTQPYYDTAAIANTSTKGMGLLPTTDVLVYSNCIGAAGTNGVTNFLEPTLVGAYCCAM